MIIERKYSTAFHNALERYRDLLDVEVGPFKQFIGALSDDRGGTTPYWDTCKHMHEKYMDSRVPQIADLHSFRVYVGESWVMIGLCYYKKAQFDYRIKVAIEDELIAVKFRLMMD